MLDLVSDRISTYELAQGTGERGMQRGLFRSSSKEKSIQRRAHWVVSGSSEFALDGRLDLRQALANGCMLSSSFPFVITPRPKGTWKGKGLFHLTLSGNDL